MDEKNVLDHFRKQKHFRKASLLLVEELSDEQLCIIPDNFQNSIGWNLVHVAVVQQKLVYTLSGVDSILPNYIVESYGKGSVPPSAMADDLKEVLTVFESLIDNSLYDYQEGLFERYRSYKTAMGGVLESVEDAIAFCTVHEAIHFGYILAQKRALGMG